MKDLATEEAENGCDKGKKWATLVSLQTINKIISFPSDLGRPL